ncbi:uncharacterized protein LOC127248020 [Andrographis paniculata]|uniref:uncharacterized protein LOC127248020 n=1 Tax=Andrographis paniculata TaxID=175694 RepID=UPI0021E7513F|nr:uncharacterized protein LOC127248020 [Andrographis paniculata]
MWVELICGLLLYRFFKRFFYGPDPRLALDSSPSIALFSVAKRLEKLNRGSKVYVGLRIPDPDSASRRNIDLVLITTKEAVVISVKNVSGLVSIDKNGNWVCAADQKHHKTEHLPDPVAETKQLVCILEEYVEQRGVSLPPVYFSYKVICPNTNFRSIHSELFPPEVITYDRWTQLKPDERNSYSGWIKDTLGGGKKKMQESFSENLHSILSTTPIWDRLELKDNEYILGEFLEFKGCNEDLVSLRKIKRSKVSHLTVRKIGMFSIADSTVRILYVPRDYRVEGPSWSSQWEEVTVRSKTELVFQPQNSRKSCKLKLSSVVSLSLSA